MEYRKQCLVGYMPSSDCEEVRHEGTYGQSFRTALLSTHLYIYIYLVLVLERLWGLVTSNTPNRAEELHALSDYCHVKTQSRTLII